MLDSIHIDIFPSSQFENGQNLRHWPVLNFRAFERPSGEIIGNIFNCRIDSLDHFDTPEEAVVAATKYLEENKASMGLATLAQEFGN